MSKSGREAGAVQASSSAAPITLNSAPVRDPDGNRAGSYWPGFERLLDKREGGTNKRHAMEGEPVNPTFIRAGFGRETSEEGVKGASSPAVGESGASRAYQRDVR